MSEALHRPAFALAGALAVLVHLAAFGVLIMGLSWSRLEPPKVVVELWSEMPPPRPRDPTAKPAAPAPKRIEVPKVARLPDVLPPPPKPEPVPPKAPPPPKPEPAPAKPEPAPPKELPKPGAPKKADAIQVPAPKPPETPAPEVKKAEAAVQEKKEEPKKPADALSAEEKQRREERKRLEEAMRQEAKRRADEQKKVEDERLREEEARRREEERLQEEERKRVRDALKQQAKVAEEQRVAQEMADSERRAAAAAAIRIQRQIDEYTARIRSAIREKVVLPPGIDGNPQAVFEVKLLKNGTVSSVKLFKSSGMAAYDRAVERAIEQAQPLPVPDDLDLFQQMRDLTLIFRPND